MVTYPARGLQRILAGSVNPELRATILDQDGDPVATSPGTLTCTITRADGTVVATDRATTATNAQAVTCALTTSEALTLDVLTAVWKVSGVARHTSHHRVVGGFMFSTVELAERAGVQPSNDLAMLRTERDRITDLIEHHTGICWSPQYDLVEFEGHGSRRHALWQRPARRLRSITIDDTAVDLTVDIELNGPAGVISGLTFAGWCQIGVEHGHDAPPADLRDAAITAAADALLRRGSTLGPRVRSATNDAGVTQQFSFAGEGHPTGIDEVDAVIMAYSRARI